ncbi:complement factor b, like [Brienomyrus brachyistius]|uniref:complement factor b, like n=1 Tax=Brienomyrus brachyistius TaxID=42636 RepID=UPI0020B3AD82|nr:complement factor b, like [Brienomyrus brachyistius]
MVRWIHLNLLIVMLFSSPCLGIPMKKCEETGLSMEGGNYTLSDGTNVNSIVSYICAEGFYPFPSATRRCLRSGRWHPGLSKNNVPSCKKVTCPDPSSFEQGSVSPNQMQYFVNDVTTYKCFDGYKFFGSDSRTCQANGKWNGSTPICDHSSGHCPDPGVPPGARRTGHHFGIDDKVTYRCDQDLILVGSEERVCQESSEWSGTEPACYYKHTYDTPAEVHAAFGSALNNHLSPDHFNSSGSQHGKKIRADAGENLHIYIALDVSDSVDEVDFSKSKDCVLKLIEKISYYEVTPKYDISAFATEVTPIVDILAPKTKEKYINLETLRNFSYVAKGDKSGTNIALVFNKIYEKMSVMKTRNEKGYKDVRNVIIIFTDGIANMGGRPKDVVNQIQAFMHSVVGADWEDHLDIYAFGVGLEADTAALQQLASKKEQETHFFKLQDLKSLEETFDKMIDEGNTVGLCGLHRTYGEVTSRRRHPWLVKIFIPRDGKGSNCVGALITSRFILTAAHCFRFEDKPTSITITTDVRPYLKLKVKTFKMHPKYNIQAKKDQGIPEFYDYDVALIELDKKDDVKFSVDVRPICIPCTKETSRALGLPETATCKEHEDILLKSNYEQASFTAANDVKKNVTIKLGPRRDSCVRDAIHAERMNVTKASDIVTENFLCTGGIEDETNHIACKGDSGGALYVERKKRLIQVGVTSWGVIDLCTTRNTITSTEHSRDFHINLFKVQPFIREYLEKEDEDYGPTAFIN